MVRKLDHRKNRWTVRERDRGKHRGKERSGRDRRVAHDGTKKGWEGCKIWCVVFCVRLRHLQKA